jgi:hypothetical protein
MTTGGCICKQVTLLSYITKTILITNSTETPMGDHTVNIQFAENISVAELQAERDALKIKVHELSTEVERLSRELARG